MQISLLVLSASFMLVSAKLFYIEVKYPLLEQPEQPLNGVPWPMPQIMNSSSDRVLYLVKNRFKITNNMMLECDIIDENIKFYSNIIFPARYSFNTSIESDEQLLTELSIEVALAHICPGFPDSNMDESCKFI